MLFAVLALVWMSSIPTGFAADTTIKCNCTCKDSVGSWKASCYSTSDCTVCCSYPRKISAGARAGGVPTLIEIENAKGEVGMTPLKETGPRK